MSNPEQEALEFFRSAILEPALKLQRSFNSEKQVSIVSDFGAIEAAYWAGLGARIGYFHAKDAQELISSSKGVFSAWSNLQEFQIPGNDLENIIQMGVSGVPALNEAWFPAASQIGPEAREFLHNTFQDFLLLSSEHILDDDSRYFLDSIGWSGDADWNSRREGSVYPQVGSVQEIGAGFANVLNFWEETYSCSRFGENKFRHMRTPPKSWGAIEDTMRNFTQIVIKFLFARFNLRATEIVERYFVLAGEFVSRARENSPAWLDARLKIFEKLILLIKHAGGKVSETEDATRLWSVFRRATEGVPTQNDIKSVESSLKQA